MFCIFSEGRIVCIWQTILWENAWCQFPFRIHRRSDDFSLCRHNRDLKGHRQIAILFINKTYISIFLSRGMVSWLMWVFVECPTENNFRNENMPIFPFKNRTISHLAQYYILAMLFYVQVKWRILRSVRKKNNHCNWLPGSILFSCPRIAVIFFGEYWLVLIEASGWWCASSSSHSLIELPLYNFGEFHFHIGHTVHCS